MHPRVHIYFFVFKFLSSSFSFVITSKIGYIKITRGNRMRKTRYLPLFSSTGAPVKKCSILYSLKVFTRISS